MGKAFLHKLFHDERLKELERHFLRKTALVHFQFRSNHNDAAAGIVDALSEQVLAETPLLAAQHVGQGL